MMMNSWEYERGDERLRLYQRSASGRAALILQTPTHHVTLEFDRLLERHDFQTSFEHHLLTCGWHLVGYARRRLAASGE